jgi:hypothetical protein
LTKPFLSWMMVAIDARYAKCCSKDAINPGRGFPLFSFLARG